MLRGDLRGDFPIASPKRILLGDVLDNLLLSGYSPDSLSAAKDTFWCREEPDLEASVKERPSKRSPQSIHYQFDYEKNASETETRTTGLLTLTPIDLRIRM